MSAGVLLYLGGTAYLSVRSLQSPKVLLLLGGGGVMLMTVAFGATLVRWRTRTAPASAPWKLRPAWETREIDEERAPDGFSPISVGFSAAIAGFCTASFLYNCWRAPTLDFLMMVNLFPVAVLVMAGVAGRRVVHRWTYGISTLVMDDMPGRLGKRLEARLQTPIAYNDVPDEGFHVRLFCGRRVRTGRTMTTVIEWETETQVKGRPTTESEEVEVPVSFDLPPLSPRGREGECCGGWG